MLRQQMGPRMLGRREANEKYSRMSIESVKRTVQRSTSAGVLVLNASLG